MLSRNWLSHIALVGIALSALLGIALVHHHPNSPWVITDGLTPATRSQERKTENEQAAQDALAWLRAVRQQGKSDEAANESTQIASDSQKLKEPLDLAAQWSSAMAAEQLVRLSIWQIYIGIAGIFAVVASLLYTRKALELTRESLKSGEANALAANKSAIAAEKSVATAIESAERQLRAYVAIAQPEITKNPHTKEMEIHLVFKNFGVTPAEKVTFKLEKSLFEKIGENELLPFTEAALTLPECQIPPGHPHTICLPFDELLGFDKWATYRAKEERVYVWGRVDYKDCFGNPRWITFQLVHFLGSVKQFSYCEAGNDAS